ncbi:MAG TPA: LL-diaminopimelate aminotransferase [Gemmatimonas aurantiaca]|uniref:LL-diaminopimelate aminotransferase n=2 Tax=Gemmatimonas aurantiaca TaxID=173480 RepID=A0A3D4V7D9_9BACT|nr:aminotransferase class I/II-fold pyridoxal phosphate-dependent enzyme [Gemmatimonas aurantiaca]HCT56744.1 LL-diaminopimelate aminotransferase [Gemmatimonas aurantiaca]
MTHTLSKIPPYVFYELDARRARHRAAGKTLIDVGIGSPDGPIPSVVVETMQRVAADRALSGYPYFQAHPTFTAAVTGYMQSRFQVALDPAREVLALAGSKEGIAELVLSHAEPGDVVLVPEVYYPVYARSTLLAGAEPVFVPFLADGRLDLDAITPDQARRARVMIINYPGNPTTTSVTLDELARYVAFAEQHDILLLSDLAYSELSFDGYVVPSVLQVPGASRVAVETHTCSKSFNMAGVRIAFVAGKQEAIARLDAYRSNIGYGVSTLSQLAGATAFAHAAELVPPIVTEYRARRDRLVAAMRAGGWDVASPAATMYLWLDVPAGFDDWGWVDALMAGPGVVVTPGIAFGDAGRGKFRVSLVQNGDTLAAAAAGITSTVPA